MAEVALSPGPGNMAVTEQTAEELTVSRTVVKTSQESVQYETFVRKFARLVDAVKSVVVEVAVLAFSEQLISESNKCDAANRNVGEYQRANDLLQVIMDRVKGNDAHFDTFVTILQKVNKTDLAFELKRTGDPTIQLLIPGPITDGTTKSSSADRDSVPSFKCPCGNCSLQSFLRDRSKCPGLKTNPFPYLNLSRLMEPDKELLHHQLIRDTNAIIEDYRNVMVGAFKALETCDTPVDKIITSVFSFGREGLPKPIPIKHGSELSKITTITGLQTFLLCHGYITFINYRILESLVIQHCPTYKDKFDAYLKRFTDFCRRNIFEVPASVLSSSPASDLVLVVKVIDEMWFGAKRNTSDCVFTMNDINAVQNKIAEVIDLERGYIHLLDVSKGCVQIAFSILSCQDTPIFPLTTAQLSKLIRLGIIVLYHGSIHSETPVETTDGHTNDIPITKTENDKFEEPHNTSEADMPPIATESLSEYDSTQCTTAETERTSGNLDFEELNSATVNLDVDLLDFEIHNIESNDEENLILNTPRAGDNETTISTKAIEQSPCTIPIQETSTSPSDSEYHPIISSSLSSYVQHRRKVTEQEFPSAMTTMATKEEEPVEQVKSCSTVGSTPDPDVSQDKANSEEVAKLKDRIERIKQYKEDCQHLLGKVIEEKSQFQSELSLTRNQCNRKKFEMKIQKKEEEMKWWQERMICYEEQIDKHESWLNNLEGTKVPADIQASHLPTILLDVPSDNVRVQRTVSMGSIPPKTKQRQPSTIVRSNSAPIIRRHSLQLNNPKGAWFDPEVDGAQSCLRRTSSEVYVDNGPDIDSWLHVQCPGPSLGSSGPGKDYDRTSHHGNATPSKPPAENTFAFDIL